MEKNVISEINNGLQTAFVDSDIDSNLAYRPQFITNDHKRGIKVLTHIENQLMHCDEFSISVAFISRSGFVELSETLKELERRGIKGRILTSATGTGKTYASAFAMRNEKPKKALFIVHRELIARQALKSYKKVFGSTKKLALLSGNSKEYDADILFATMSMMAKTETLERYKVDEFDWICIDEVHRAGSESYQKIMNYFQPDF